MINFCMRSGVAMLGVVFSFLIVGSAFAQAPIAVYLNDGSFCLEPSEEPDQFRCDDFNPAADTHCDFDNVCSPNSAFGSCVDTETPPAPIAIEFTILNAGAATEVDMYTEVASAAGKKMSKVDDVIACFSELDCECKKIGADWICRPKLPLRIYYLYKVSPSNINCPEA